MPTIKELWAVQLQEYPDSIRLSKKEIADWILSAPFNNHGTGRLWQQMALCLCDPIGVFYRTSAAPDAWVGWRYGLHGSEYSAGWPRWDYTDAF